MSNFSDQNPQPETVTRLPEKTNGQPSRLEQWLAQPMFWFVTALLFRLLYMLTEAGSSPLFFMPLLDEKEAVDSALELLNGTTPREPYFKAPGYSWIIAGVMKIFGDGWPWGLRIIQHTAGASMVWMAANLAGKISRAGKSRRITIIARGAIFAFYAPMIRLEENISLDFWVVFFQSTMIYNLCVFALNGVRPKAFLHRHGNPYIRYGSESRWQYKKLLLSGLLAAAAWLIRPIMTVILPGLAVWVLYITWKRWRPTTVHPAMAVLVFVLPTLMAAGAVTARNYRVSGQPLTLPWQGGFSFYEANKPGANGRYYLQSAVAESSAANPTYSLSIEGYRQSLSPAAREAFDKKPDFGAVNSWWMQRGIDSIKAHPVQWAGLMAKKGVYLLSDQEIFNYEDFDLQRSRSPLLRFTPFTFGVVFGFAFGSLGLIHLVPRRRRAIVTLLLIYTFTTAGAVALYFTSGRMRMPIAFPIIILAGIFPAAFMAANKAQRSLATVMLLLGFVISFGDWWGVRSEDMSHADLARMSNAAWHRGRYEQALDLALEAEKLAPDYPALPRLKGQALYYLNRLPAARVEFEKSVYLLNDETSRNNLEVIQREMQKGQPSPSPDAARSDATSTTEVFSGRL